MIGRDIKRTWTNDLQGQISVIDGPKTATTNFSFKSCLLGSWATLRDNWVQLLLAAFVRDLLALLCGSLIFAVLVMWKEGALIAAGIAACIARAALQCAYLKYCLSLQAKQKTDWRAIFQSTNAFLELLMATICIWCSVLFSSLLLVVPGIMSATKYSLTGLALIDQNLDSESALTASKEMLKGFGWQAFGLLTIYFIGEVVLGWWSYGFEALLVVSLCTLYKHIRSQEAVQ